MSFMEKHMFIVSWGGESRIEVAVSMDALWKRIRKRYCPGCKVMIEDDHDRKVYTR